MVKGTFDKVMLGASIATAVLMLIVGYSYMVNPVSFPLAGPLGLLFPAFLAADVFLLLAFLLFKKYRLMAVPFVGLLMAYFPVRIYCPVNLGHEAPKGSISVMSYNALSFHGQNSEYGNTPDNPLVQYLMEKDCDIVCIQEDCYFLPDTVEEMLKEKYPYIRHLVTEGRTNCVGIYTKYRIVSCDTLPIDSRNNLVGEYILETPHGRLLVVNCHLETNGLSYAEKSHFQRMMKGKMEKDSIKEESMGLFAKLAYASQVRSRQMEKVMDFVRRNKGMKILLCGDFNENPLSYPHHLASRQLRDCYVETAMGLGWSYCHNAMRVRIDNIFCSEDIKPYECQVDRSVPYSDHFPIFCMLKMD